MVKKKPTLKYERASSSVKTENETEHKKNVDTNHRIIIFKQFNIPSSRIMQMSPATEGSIG